MAYKVAVCGGAGGIGQPLSMLLAQNPRVAEVVVIDVDRAMTPAAGVAADLSHMSDLDCPATCRVNGYTIVTKKDGEPDPPPNSVQLAEALTGCHLVLIPAGIPRKPGMTRDDLFKVNAGIAKSLVEACADLCPEAVLGMIVNPVNSVVPAMAALYEAKGLNPMKVVGVTLLDVVRARKFMCDDKLLSSDYLSGLDGSLPADSSSKACSAVLVIGGHAGKTILPLLEDSLRSQGNDRADNPEQLAALDTRIQNAGTEVVDAKAGAGSATLSMAHSAAVFARRVIAGLDGVDNASAVCCAYVKSDLVADLSFFASPVKFGPGGSVEVLPFDVESRLSEYEKGRLKNDVIPQLKGEIEKGAEVAAQ
jgi:malate dehydrogenase